MEQGAITDFYDRSFGLVSEVIQQQGLTPTTAGFGHYFGIPAATVELEVGFGTNRPVEPASDVRVAALPGGRCARAVHVGAYSGLGDSWRRPAEWIVEQGDEPAESMWEEYVTMPTPDADPSDLRTVLTWPLVERTPR